MNTSNVRGWLQLASDVNWEDYGGSWARKASDGSWYVLQFMNLHDAMGEDECKASGIDRYDCDVKRVDLASIGEGELASALRSCGYRRTSEGLISDSGDLISAADPHYETAIVEMAVGYGLGAPLESFTGDTYPLRVRAQARRYADQCMRDAALLAARLARPVNAIGSTADEYGRGEVLLALDRGPFDGTKNLIRKMHGKLPLDASGELDMDAIERMGRKADQ